MVYVKIPTCTSYHRVSSFVRQLVFTTLFFFMLSGCSGDSGDSGKVNSETTPTSEEDSAVVQNSENVIAAMENNDIINGYHLTGSTDYSEFDGITSFSVRSYDYDLNRIDIKTTQVSFFSDEPDEITTSREFFDDSGRLFLRETPENNPLRTDEYTFDDDGNIVLRLTTSTIDKDNETADFEYDTSGKLIRVVRNFPDKAVIKVFSYDDSGMLVKTVEEESVKNTSDGLPDSVVTGTKLFFYSQGRRVRAEVTSTIENHITGTFLYEYDGNGNVIEETIQGDDYYFRTVYTYEKNQEPVYNFWLRRFKYFP